MRFPERYPGYWIASIVTVNAKKILISGIKAFFPVMWTIMQLVEVSVSGRLFGLPSFLKRVYL